MNSSLPCPCHSNKTYGDCCQPFHQGTLPNTALELMRSRYAAYAFRLSDYLIKTTHPANAQYSENFFNWRRRLAQYFAATQFHGLEILDNLENGDLAVVTFKALARQNDEEASFIEKSLFEKVDQQWLYLSGEHFPLDHPPVPLRSLDILPLAYYGDPILRRKADPIPEITPSILDLVQKMEATMAMFNGIGIAAPQVKHSLRIFLIRKPSLNNDELEFGETQVFINPKLSSPSQQTNKLSEGCLSLPSLRSQIERPLEIQVEYMDLQGNLHQEIFTDFHARMIMHENDHLNGVLFIDRLPVAERKKIQPALLNLEKRLLSLQKA